MDLFEKLGNLSQFLDRELRDIETSLSLILKSGRKYNNGPAEIAEQLRDEVKELSEKVDQLIKEGEDQFNHFEGFIKGMIDTLAEFDEKIDSIQNYAANYGYKIELAKERINIKESLEQVFAVEQEETEEEKVQNEPSKEVIESPNILELGLVSKGVLKSLGFKLGQDSPLKVALKKQENAVKTPQIAQEEKKEELDFSSIDETPIASILKKPKPMKKLDASLVNQSRVEISPGLFVKRPSSKTKKAPPEQEEKKEDSSLLSSPQMPQLNTIDLTQIITERPKNIFCQDEEEKEDVSEVETPEIPNFQSDEGRLLSARKMTKKNIIQRIDKENNKEDESPPMPTLNSQHAQLSLSAVKRPKSPTPLKKKTEDSFLDNSPEMPALKTINLANVIQKSKGTYL